MLTLFAVLTQASLAFTHRPVVVGTPIRATLDDGQVLVGDVVTDDLVLVTGQGPVTIPLRDVGEVVPATGNDLDVANGSVSVWLRNGTELIGRWADPHLEVGIAIGKTRTLIDLPMDDLQRFQTTAAMDWPVGELYRVRTTWGDDFVIDPARTQLVVESTLGRFPITLSDCVHAQPVSDPTEDWRIQLHTGTVILGKVANSSMTFALPMGPESITVPMKDFAFLERQYWNPTTPPYNAYGGVIYDDSYGGSTPSVALLEIAESKRAEKEARATSDARGSEPPASAPGASWFDVESLREAREALYEQ